MSKILISLLGTCRVWAQNGWKCTILISQLLPPRGFESTFCPTELKNNILQLSALEGVRWAPLPQTPTHACTHTHTRAHRTKLAEGARCLLFFTYSHFLSRHVGGSRPHDGMEADFPTSLMRSCRDPISVSFTGHKSIFMQNESF